MGDGRLKTEYGRWGSWHSGFRDLGEYVCLPVGLRGGLSRREMMSDGVRRRGVA